MLDWQNTNGRDESPPVKGCTRADRKRNYHIRDEVGSRLLEQITIPT